MKKSFSLCGLGAAVLVLTACGKAPAPIAEGPRVDGETIAFPANSPQLKALTLMVATAASEDRLPLSGRLIWDETRTVRVFAPLGGRIVQLAAKPGDQVKAGDTLALLTSPDFGAAQAESAKADADFSVAAKAIERARELHKAGVIADKDLEQTEADYARAGAERNRTAARTRAYGASGNGVDQKFALRAPIAGIVVERNANPGQEVRADASDTALFVISDPSRLWVNLDLPENAIGAVQPGMKATLRIATLGDETREATIEHVSDFVDPDSRRIRARALVDNKDRRLKAEMFTTAEVVVNRGEFIRVPASTVILLDKTQYVFVEDAPGKYRRQTVKAEDSGFGSMRVRAGLKSGEKVVSEGALLLQQLISTTVRK
ncbi:MAG: efflux RND transporter periplasmic adaptor subunit [Rhodocyclaceae bacterium]|nr:efflux RND transporter periplasmic adaptor subunit [Rhodocyclaceae bacterium]